MVRHRTNVRNGHSKYRVGDWVRVPFGESKVEALVIEDRGNVGSQGRHLLRVEVPSEPADPVSFEVRSSDIEPAGPRPTKLDKQKMIAYLKAGGLIDALRPESYSIRNPPHVWLRYDSFGNVVHTFTEAYGQVGGERVPYGALWGQRVSEPKVDEVVRVLTSFGLSTKEAHEVIHSVGTTPKGIDR